VEAVVFDPTNPHVLGPHLCAAAAEVPLTEPDLLARFGPSARLVVESLTADGWLRRRPTGWYWTRPERASDLTDLRGSGGSPVRIIEDGTGRLLGTVDAAAAAASTHPGAVYVHLGVTHLVRTLDLTEGVATVVEQEVDYSTVARSISDITVTSTHEETTFADGLMLARGEVVVTSQVVSFQRRDAAGRSLGTESLDLPPQTLATAAVWWTLPESVLVGAGLTPADIPGALHAAEHASIGLLPLFATCDRWDIGGVSTAAHADTGRPSVFVYDGYPGGAGFAARGFDVVHAWLAATREVIADCPCDHGCPSCVQSPKCGNGNHPLDKAGAVATLDLVLARLGPPAGGTSDRTP
jgi:DEAD/DEAH box helicase domain-containing protein